MNPKYPEINVRLVGQDGNAFSIMGRVAVALRRHGIDKEEIEEYYNQAMSGDYGHLLRTTMEWVSTDDDELDYED